MDAPDRPPQSLAISASTVLSLSISTLTVIPGAGQDTIYAGTGDVSSGANGNGGAGIYRSTDSGQTWTTLGQNEFGGLRVTGIQPTPVGAGATQTILVASSGEGAGPDTGIWRSSDGGGTWTQLSGGASLPAGDVTEFVRGADVGSGNALKATYYAALSGIYDDNGDGFETAVDVSAQQGHLPRRSSRSPPGISPGSSSPPMRRCRRPPSSRR